MADLESAERVRQAIVLLTNDEILRLHEWAKYLIRVRLRRQSTTEDYEDLFIEAIAKTLSGERRWPPEKTPDLAFYWFLHEAMRSIADNWAKQCPHTYRDSELAAKDEESGLPRSVFDGLSCQNGSIEDTVTRNDLIAKIPVLVGRSDEEKLILRSWLDGKAVADIEKTFHFSKKKCETTLRHLRRSVAAIREGLL